MYTYTLMLEKYLEGGGYYLKTIISAKKNFWRALNSSGTLLFAIAR